MQYYTILAIIIFGFFTFPYINDYLNDEKHTNNANPPATTLSKKEIKRERIEIKRELAPKRKANKDNISSDSKKKKEKKKENIIKNKESTVQINSQRIFKEDFSAPFILEESPSMEKSLNKNWWLNSGAYFISDGSVGKTLSGNLKKGEKWQIKFNNYNPDSTLNGFQPQNIFRLVTKTKWFNFESSFDFNIKKYNAINAKHRNQSNGVLFFIRYIDSDNLYYAGLRVDGAVVIKKKLKGKYTTLGYKKILNGIYDIEKNPNLIPINQWFSMKTIVKNTDNKVNIKLFIKKDGNWEEVLSVFDSVNTILEEGYAGIRTDFADVEFDNYTVKEITN